MKLPPATSHGKRAPSSESVKSRDNNTSLTAPARLECLIDDSFESDEGSEKQKDIDLALTYFRPKRVEKLIHQSRTWKELSQQNLTTSRNPYDDANNIMNKTWYAGGGNFFKKSNNHPWNLNLNGKEFDVVLEIYSFMFLTSARGIRHE